MFTRQVAYGIQCDLQIAVLAYEKIPSKPSKRKGQLDGHTSSVDEVLGCLGLMGIKCCKPSVHVALSPLLNWESWATPRQGIFFKYLPSLRTISTSDKGVGRSI